jgi:hypothetical protein
VNPSLRLSSRTLLLCSAIPAALIVGASLLVRTEFGSLGVPLLGPCAGLLYGHSDCTLANAAPLWSWIGTGALALAAGGVVLVRRSPRRLPRASALVVWTLAWSHWGLLGWFSAINTTS